jgi:hypothetical protein
MNKLCSCQTVENICQKRYHKSQKQSPKLHHRYLLQYKKIVLYLRTAGKSLFWRGIFVMRGNDNVVGIATRYGLDGPGFKLRWERVSSDPLKLALRLIQLPVQGVPRFFSEVKRPGSFADHPFSSMKFLYG